MTCTWAYLCLCTFVRVYTHVTGTNSTHMGVLTCKWALQHVYIAPAHVSGCTCVLQQVLQQAEGCTCAHVHVLGCTRVLQHAHGCTCAHLNIRLYTCVTAGMQVYLCLYAHQGMHMCKQTLQHTRVYLCLHTCVLQHAHGCTCALYTLEHFMKDWVPWEGTHAGVGEEHEEIGVAETKR